MPVSVSVCVGKRTTRNKKNERKLTHQHKFCVGGCSWIEWKKKESAEMERERNKRDMLRDFSWSKAETTTWMRIGNDNEEKNDAIKTNLWHTLQFCD